MALRLVVLSSARLDLQWFRIYYKEHFPEGMDKAVMRFERCTKLLCERPNMGRSAGKPPRQRFSVPQTPFTLLYRQKQNALEILRVLDQRKANYLEELYADDHPH